ncbi:MAG: DUF2939 domain-containing protein [Asticcacaulis sp.]
MGRIFALIVAIALVVSAGLFYFSPTIAFYDIRSACKSTDIEALAKLIDFDSVRASLKTQLDAGPKGVAAPAPSALSDPVGATGNALKSIGNSIGNAVNNLVNPSAPKPSSIVPPDPNTFLTPQALLALTYGYGSDAPKTTADELGKAPAPQIAFFSLDRVRLTVKDVDHGTTTFTFERRGLTRWVLVHIGLPMPESDAEKTASSSPAE